MCKPKDIWQLHLGGRIGWVEEVLLPQTGLIKKMFRGYCLECGGSLYYPHMFNPRNELQAAVYYSPALVGTVDAIDYRNEYGFPVCPERPCASFQLLNGVEIIGELPKEDDWEAPFDDGNFLSGE